MPSNLAFEAPLHVGDVIEEMIEYYEEIFPGQDAMKDEANRKVWNPIFNVVPKADGKHRNKGIGRYITTLAGVSSEVEQNADTVWVARKRAMMEVRLAQIAAALRLADPEKGSSEMAVPKSGSRFLLTRKGCPRQSLHKDFGVGKSKNGNLEYASNPGYSFMCSG